jgi:arabinan endo-1,5-alpha-L-arabinosidase
MDCGQFVGVKRVVAAAVVAVVCIAAGVVLGLWPTDSSSRPLTGDLAAHDPAIVVDGDGGYSYVFATGSTAGDGNIQTRRSDDGLHWEYAGEVWKKKPEWIVEAVPKVANLWAPDLIEHDGTWYLYYAASSFGSNHSVIALATNTTLDKSDPDYEWVDQGLVLASQTSDDFNAIDPAIIEDADGTPWMAFGSFWSGIRMVELDWADGKPVDPSSEPLRLADRGVPPNAIEGAYVVSRGGWYYLFVSRDFCCKGEQSTYSIAVGRSRDVTGPYLDKAGVPMLENGGTTLLETDGDEIGPGGQSYSDGNLAYHFYDGAAGGRFTLAIREVAWGRDGWPSF